MRLNNSTIFGIVLAGLIACDGGTASEGAGGSPDQDGATNSTPTPTGSQNQEDIGELLAVVNGFQVGSEAFVLASDDAPARRAFDLGSMVEHLAAKFAWVDALPDDDHVARVRIRDVDARAERLDEVVAEIGMSRELLEG